MSSLLYVGHSYVYSPQRKRPIIHQHMEDEQLVCYTAYYFDFHMNLGNQIYLFITTMNLNEYIIGYKTDISKYPNVHG